MDEGAYAKNEAQITGELWIRKHLETVFQEFGIKPLSKGNLVTN